MARPRKNPKTVINVCEECNKEFEIGYYKRHQKFCSKRCVGANSSVKQKIIQSQQIVYDEKYDGKHPMQTAETKNAFKCSMREKYGVDHALQNDTLLNKSKSTKKEKYGDEHFNNYEKAKQTCLQKYGVENFTLTSEFKKKYKQTCLQRHNVDHASKSKQYKDSHKLSMFKKFLNSDRFKHFEPNFNIESYDGVTPRFNKKYEFKCTRCNSTEQHDISDGKYPRCSHCDKQFSNFQTEILNFIKQEFPNESIISNDRTILHPFELDIVLPNKKIAIECNSLCFHSEIFGSKNKSYHVNKTKGTLAKEFKLIHVLDSEWRDKKDIVKSIIKTSLGCSNKIYARNCVVKELTPKQSNRFLKENHIQDVDRSSVKLGLFNDDKLVSVMTFCKPRFNKQVQWELSRFCNLTHHKITGGASKLFKYFIKQYDPETVISYSDRRLFDGNLYPSIGFNFVDNTPPNYWYIIDNYSTIQNRVSWQKHKLKDKLEGFDPSISEWENMKNHGFDRIWDCGNSKWIWSKS